MRQSLERATGIKTKRSEVLKSLNRDYFRNASEFKRVLQDTAIWLCDDVYRREANEPFWFTDHGPTHSNRVLFYALKLAERLPTRLNSVETLFLAASYYLHDVGMARIPEGYTLDNGFDKEVIDAVRREHPTAVHGLLPKHYERFEPLADVDQRAYRGLPDLCAAHSTAHFARLLPTLISESQPDLRFDYLARILLLADELDLTVLRAPHGHRYYDSLPASSNTASREL